ncbi:hypothetical protein COW57_03375 [Candidatus Roizmanbacteria bacterium CG17_big_fil_post_rev_8_21_14_2_50_39_7]|uniref:Polymerase nucleotidyl transferase domain-containing protein n=1 Tax=Candidatus Roizmanbacteria bacterium CG17_big_fil_post_rev_8_21_14_2_50_39_7 TaxID=1974858 RepID=A0A2M7EJN2_9BACT|nr:MAG: hypothetical protein COW57_03375 [Candidatus Roizmanbacteria bacterium CG17_big_fil_post_rev_8_21_14_2_50_39_7]
MIVNPFEPELIDKMSQVLKKNDVVYAGIFGSYAKNMQKNESDIDLLIEFNPHKRKTLFDMEDIQYELQNIFNKKVDLVTKNSLNKYIKNEIENSVKVIYG